MLLKDSLRMQLNGAHQVETDFFHSSINHSHLADTEAIPSYQILEIGSSTVDYQRPANYSFFQPSSENHNSSFTPSKDNELIDQNSSSES